MTGRPTFSEFLTLCRKDIVKRNDGSYYTIVNYKKAKGMYMGVIAGITLALILIRILTIHQISQFWPTRLIDFQIWQTLAIVLSIYPWYLFSRFERIPENTDAYAYASGLKFRRKQYIIIYVICGVIILLAALQSTGAAYVRYWLDGEQRITEASIDFHSKTDLKAYAVNDFADGDSVIYIPASSGITSAAVSVTTSGSPEPLQLMLDGKAAHVFEEQEFRWFWDADYFVQRGYIDYANVHDGSTLTLTCGDLTREWVFDVADEEAS